MKTRELKLLALLSLIVWVLVTVPVIYNAWSPEWTYYVKLGFTFFGWLIPLFIYCETCEEPKTLVAMTTHECNICDATMLVGEGKHYVKEGSSKCYCVCTRCEPTVVNRASFTRLSARSCSSFKFN